MSTTDNHFFSKEALNAVPWLLIGKLATFIFYFLISILIVRNLSPADFGIYTLLTSLAEYLIVVCGLGINFALLRYIPELATLNSFGSVKKLLAEAALIQTAMVILCGAALYASGQYFSQFLHIPMQHYAAYIMFLLAAFLLKEYLNNVCTAFFKSKLLAIMSILQAIIFLLFLTPFSALHNASIERIVIVYGGSIWLSSLITLFFLVSFLQGMPSRQNEATIKRGRFYQFSLPLMTRNVMNRLIEQYSEIFFLGYFAGAAAAGYYALGSYIPQMMISMLPLTLHTLLTSASAEAYVKNPKSLPFLISGLYQMLILLCVPIACFGLFFSKDLIVLIYGKEMLQAGYLAAFFSVFKVLNLIWVPLSMGLTAKEKNFQTLWLDLLPVILTLPLDYLLIPKYGLWGAVASISLVFLSTLPFKLWAISKLLGGIYFPLQFFLKILLPALLLGGVLKLINPLQHILMIVPVLLLYFALFTFSLKQFRIIKPADMERFQTVGINSFNKLIHFFTT